jgi:hypothetical protein
MPMSTLSRREEETLLKAAKARALHECDDIVKGRQIILLLTTSVLNVVARVRQVC